MGSIFVSYRREGTAGEAGRLGDRLVACFGDEQVFIDINTIAPGDKFREELREAVSACTVLIAVIGKEWLTMTDSAGVRRLNDPNDYVAMEISTALAENKLVVPVLVQGAAMPDPRDLPVSLQTLGDRNAYTISYTQWNRDVEVLIEKLRKVVVPAAAGGLKSFATKIHPLARWTDLIVPSRILAQLSEIENEIINAGQLASQWNITRPEDTQGIKALLHGPEGTGKTLAAKILANDLLCDLYKVDYGAVTGQQVIDTARNLQQLVEAAAERNVPRRVETSSTPEEAGDAELSEAVEKGVILLFEDAETLFGAQTSDPSRNLLRLVKLRGNLIFTTTTKSALDKKLLGLCRHVVEFPFPDEADRERIWRASIPLQTPIADDIDYRKLALTFKISGEEIRNAVHNAAAAANRDSGSVAMRDLEFYAARYGKDSGGSMPPGL